MGCVRKDDGTVHFFVNGVDQGPAATSVPADVYGVIDLYGQAAQATIVDNSGKFQCRNSKHRCQIFISVLRFLLQIGHISANLNQIPTVYVTLLTRSA